MALSGRNSRIKVGENIVQDLNDASFAINGESIDVTVFDGDGWKKKISGFVDASISISGFYKPDDTTGQAALRQAVLSGTVVSDFTFLADKDVATSGFTCDALVTSFEVSAGVGGAVAVSISLESDGEIAVSS